MLTIRNLHKAFGSQVIFDGASFQMNEGDRWALMGPNGAGKSTLFRLLMGEQEPDDGEIIVRRGLRIGYLPQENAGLAGGTVVEEALGRPEHATGAEEAEAKKILMGLGFRVTDFTRSVAELSGGWAMRVAIARLLLEKPDLLLMDEPTNHLDLESLLWFQDYLKYYRAGILLISHDRAFVNALVGGIAELREHRLNFYPGDYEHFLDVRRQEAEQLMAAYERQQKEIKETELFISRFRASAAKAPQVQSRIKMLEKMERIEIPPDARRVKIRFPAPERPGLRTVMLNGVAKSYGPVKVYENLDFELVREQKMAFVGHNGAGKSTLLKMLAGVIPTDSGERVLGLNVNVGYYAQHRVEMLNSQRTVLDEAMDTRRMIPDLLVRTILGAFLFQNDAVYKKVGVLSGGEKSRLALVKLLLDPPNVLLLDEPTTHLDMASVETLVEALKDYNGTLCFISHDVYFVNALADHIVHVEAGKVTVYPGNYEYFQRRQAQKKEESQEAPAPARAPTPAPSFAVQSPASPATFPAAQSPADRGAQKAQEKAKKKLKRRIKEIEEELVDLNNEMASVFIKSDYKKLMELDVAIKNLTQELDAKKAELAD